MNVAVAWKLRPYFKGALIAAVLLFCPAVFVPALIGDPRPWVLFPLGVILVGTHPPMKFSLLGMSQRTPADRMSILFVNAAAYLSFLPLYIHYSLLLHRAAAPSAVTSAQIAAAIVATVGICLRAQAIRTLGRWFTAAVSTSDEQEVVQRGVYRHLRHPSYTGALLFWGSMPFLFGLWHWSFVTWPMLLAAYLWRIHVEEAALAQHFGASYVDYQHRTKRLVPLVF